MDFSWALRKMKEGLRVRRACWDELEHFPSEYAHVELVHFIPGLSPVFLVTCNDGHRESYRVNDAQLLAEDWQLAD